MAANHEPGLILAAGGIVWKMGHTPALRVIAVIHRARYNDWCLPKGKPATDESLESTALREVKEETGCEAKITNFAGTITYTVKDIPKVVFFWNMDIVGDCAFTPSEEVDQLVWMTPLAAIERLDHPEERQLVARTISQGQNMNCQNSSSTLDSLLRFFSARYRRLSGSLDAFCSELEELICKTGSSEQCWAMAARELLANAGEALRKLRLDEGWKLFHAAVRMRVFGLQENEIQNESAVVREEADKLSSWRQKSIYKLIGHPDYAPRTVSHYELYSAMFIRDEHYNNQAYKDSLSRKKALTLMLILLFLLIFLFILFWFCDLPPSRESGGVNDQGRLLGAVLFGLLGSTFSAMTKMTDSAKSSSRIPEMVGSARITFLRVLMGGASAMILYVIVRSGLISAITVDSVFLKLDEPYPLYLLSFVSGFSERFVLKAIEKMAGKD